MDEDGKINAHTPKSLKYTGKTKLVTSGIILVRLIGCSGSASNWCVLLLKKLTLGHFTRDAR